MFSQLFPLRIDNTYRGHKFALPLFWLIVLVKTAMSVNSIFLGPMVATLADGIPLKTFSPNAARTVLAMFAIWGLGHLMICLLCILVLLRYRALVPFMFLFLLVEHVSRKLILHFIPIVSTGRHARIFFDVIPLALISIGLALSLWSGTPTIRSQESTANV
jgi:hypothetical protein